MSLLSVLIVLSGMLGIAAFSFRVSAALTPTRRDGRSNKVAQLILFVVCFVVCSIILLVLLLSRADGR
ncbi:hypothetical protein [Chitinophaga nivalis]|uniref:Twin transmembrane helix small protein n=1 Tax=Chitinophaga nivalis TaxID=2991709 RepID=A0ABT3IM93_9BACT|nr:hypothetical protein [Chitinophaga nivalis]MCW3465222.1 hypothetical protein [Chitinophaga nivalis]MCW3485086.1 hypothetical protein [Chitinophaga nivalis]